MGEAKGISSHLQNRHLVTAALQGSVGFLEPLPAYNRHTPPGEGVTV